MRIAVIGATGFVGVDLCLKLAETYQVRALSRNPLPSSLRHHPSIQWQRCDLHNQKHLEASLRGCDTAVYLIHSMLPNLRLNQGTFDDFDLSLADNFGRASKLAGVTRIIYLSGLIPQTVELSAHLKSRLEVEKTLRFYFPDLTVLRAGIIAGDGGSSFTIVYNLVKRLKFMICPAWTNHSTSIVDLKDTVLCIKYCIENSATSSNIYDIGTVEKTSYIDIMRQTAKHMGLRRYFTTIPYFTLGLSRLWVSLVSGAPKSLVYPLVQSLRHEMVVRESHQLKIPGHQFKPIGSILNDILLSFRKRPPHAFKKPQVKWGWYGSVRSIQRLHLPEEKSAWWISQRYISWLTAYLPFIIKASRVDNKVKFCIPGLDIILLSFTYSKSRSTDNRVLFYIDGGWLASNQNRRGRLEFRKIPADENTALVAIHDFIPALPWYIYRYTQAKVHAIIMASFQRYLERYYHRQILRNMAIATQINNDIDKGISRAKDGTID